ncbi:MAG: hypothetical protein KKB31_03620 [Nanoarchaeota archaeon]|nr:hypothetical protein [Nanoarchaeota archaeon]
MNQNEIDIAYLREAYKLAMKSPDPSTQNGALIVNTNKWFDLSPANLVSTAFNRFPRGVTESHYRLTTRNQKYPRIVHAERGVVFNAAYNGKSTAGKIMYVPWYACAECAQAIIEGGLSEVVGYAGPERWWTEQVTEAGGDGKEDWAKSISIAMSMLDEAGVKRRIVDGPIGGVEVLFRGRLMLP